MRAGLCAYVHAYMCACLYACVVRVHVRVFVCVCVRALSRLAVEVAAICPANLVHARNYTALGGREDVLHRFTRGGEHRGSDEDVHVRTPAPVARRASRALQQEGLKSSGQVSKYGNSIFKMLS